MGDGWMDGRMVGMELYIPESYPRLKEVDENLYMGIECILEVYLKSIS